MRRCGRRPLGIAVAVALALLCASAPAGASQVAAQWRFDDGSGQRAVDDGPFGLDGRLGLKDVADAADPLRIAGLAGGALRFGGDTYVRLPAAAELAPATITLEAVVRGDRSPGASRYVVSRGADRCFAGSYGLYTGDTQGMAFYVFDGERYIVAASAGPGDVWDGRWHHVAGVFDGATVRLYVDGRPVGDPTPAAVSIAYGLATTDMYVGTYRGTCALPLSGDIDLVRIWSGALDGGAVGDLADAALAPPPTPDPAPGTVPPAPPPGRPPGAPLPAAAPGTTIDAGADGPRPPARDTPGAPPRACSVRASVQVRIPKRRAVVNVRVALRKRPLRLVKIIATRRGGKRVLAAARTGRSGRARLSFKPPASGKVRVSVVGRQGCLAVSLRI